jgi:CheY-like chemotaxis protein
MRSSKEGQNRKTILVVDDDESIRMLIQSHLEKDYNVVSMKDGQEALMHLKSKNYPDLILCDMEMPNMNGRVFLKRIKTGTHELTSIPIIFISTVKEKLLIKSVLSKGVVDYIQKPFNPQDLVEKVHETLNTSAMGHTAH